MSAGTPKPCPFCGGTNLELPNDVLDTQDDTWDKYVRCTDCDAIGPIKLWQHEAIEAWNGRQS